MRAPVKVLALGLALGAIGCSGGGDATGPRPTPTPGVQGSYVLSQVNQSQVGQLVTITNPDGTVIGLYRFEATTLSLASIQTFQLRLRYTDDKNRYGIDDNGEFRQAGPASEGSMPFTFTSKVYGDSFTGVVVGDIVAIMYDFDGDGRPDTSFGFRRAD